MNRNCSQNGILSICVDLAATLTAEKSCLDVQIQSSNETKQVKKKISVVSGFLFQFFSKNFPISNQLNLIKG